MFGDSGSTNPGARIARLRERASVLDAITDRASSLRASVGSADRTKLDEQFKTESVFYVPRFFAAAIVGENPQSFGLQTPPLSSY